jgi:hypothetical protein
MKQERVHSKKKTEIIRVQPRGLSKSKYQPHQGEQEKARRRKKLKND